jgi:hypothetical protein
MKNLLYALSACFILASCTKDVTCTCTVDGMDIMPDIVTVSECLDCDSDQVAELEAVCNENDNISGVVCIFE